MKKLHIPLVTVALLALPTLGGAQAYYVAGDFQGWAPAASPMSETSTGSGIWTETFTGLAPGRHEFKVTQGDWTWTSPAANSWLYADASGSVTISFDVNAYSDGWQATQNRIGVSPSGNPTTWTAVGDWQGWDNANGATAMSDLGGGIYMYEQRLTPGAHSWKAVVTGTWDSISSDSRSINTGNYDFTVSAGNDLAVFSVNTLSGTVQLQLIPEPSAFALVGIGLVGLFALRRRR